MLHVQEHAVHYSMQLDMPMHFFLKCNLDVLLHISLINENLFPTLSTLLAVSPRATGWILFGRPNNLQSRVVTCNLLDY